MRRIVRCVPSACLRASLLLLTALSILVTWGGGGRVAAAAPRFGVLKISGTEYLNAVDLNDQGQVTGSVQISGRTEGFRTRPLQPFNAGTDLLGFPTGGTAAFVRAMNNHGQVVGMVEGTVNGQSYRKAFRTTATGRLTDGSLLGNGDAQDINDSGEVTGISFFGEGASRGAGAYRADGPIEDKDFLGTLYPNAGDTDGYWGYSGGVAIASDGTVAGTSNLPGEAYFGFRTRTAKMIPGDSLGEWVIPRAINSSGVMVGSVESFIGPAVTISGPGAAPKRLSPPSGYDKAYAADLNDRGQVVGACSGPGKLDIAVLWESGRAVDLNTLIPPTSGWFLYTALAINGRGHILAMGRHPQHGSATLLLGPDVPADLSVDGTVTPERAEPGKEVACKLTVRNGGPNAATDVAVTVDLPAGLTFRRSNPSVPFQNGKLVFALGALKAGETRQVTFWVTASQTGEYELEAKVEGAETDSDLRDNTAPLTVNIAPAVPDLELRMTATPNPVQAGQTVTAQVTLRNLGTAPASGAKVHFSFLSGTFVSGAPDRGTVNQTSVDGADWNVGALPGGASGRLTLKFIVDRAWSPEVYFRFLGRAWSNGADANPGNNSQELHIGVKQGPDLGVLMLGSPSTIEVGELLTYDITVRNHSSLPATGVRVEDTLPAELAFVNASTTTGATSHRAGRFLWTLGNLPARGVATLTLRVRATRPGRIENVAHLTLKEPDPDTINNSSKEVTVITGGPDYTCTVLNPFAHRRRRKGKRRPWFLEGTVGVRNDGSTRASSVSRVEFWVSKDRTRSADDTPLVAAHTVPFLDAKAGTTYPLQVKTPRNKRKNGSIHKGKFLIIVVDPQNRVKETDENNNEHVVVLP